MVSFRKLFLVLAVLGLIAGTASAQVTSCSATATNVPLVRVEGLTELVGNVTITCKNGTGATGASSASFVLRSGTANFTNSLTSTATQPTTTAVADTDASTTNVSGVLASANELDFDDVVLNPAADATTVITISNIRVNANAVGAANTQISMTVTGTAVSAGPPSVSLAVLPSTSVNVALVQSGLTFSAKAANDLAQCSGSTATATLSFAPGYAYAFRAMGTTSAVSIEPVDGSGTTLASTKGVQLVAIFSNIGANTKITVPNTLRSGTAVTASTATLVSPAQDSGSTTAITPSGTTTTVIWQVNQIESTSNATARAPLTGDVIISQNGSGTSSAIGLGTIAVRGNLGPISTLSTAQPVGDSGNVVPRFTDLGGATSNVVTVVPCATTLLFPYVVSQAPWETGIAISNTSKDPSTGTNTFLFGGSKDSTGQAGTCTLYYFNGTAGGTNPAAQTTASIAPGNESVFLLGSGSASDAGVGPVPEFAGYVVAQCKFLGAHGFAFGTSGTANLGAFGYNALVLDRKASGPANPESLSQ